ncbi:MAG: uroporphyrinogen-III synthase, partial [Chloroflexota bacterium]
AYARTQIVAGPATAAALARYGLTASVVPAPFTAEQAVATLEPRLHRGCRVLAPRAQGGRDALAPALRRLGAEVDEIVLYRTESVAEAAGDAVRRLAGSAFGSVAFFSPSAVYALASAAEHESADGASRRRLLDGVTVACIGPTTAAAVERAGWRVDVVAPNTTARALVLALAGYLRSDQA